MTKSSATEVPVIQGVPVPALLREFRESLGLFQKETAKKYGVSSRTWKRWESTSKSRGGPNLSDHPQLLLDFFSWLKTDRME
jgi:DNA-binding transcriptional regulator YiaG